MKSLHLIVKQTGKPVKFTIAILWTMFILIASGMSSGTVKELNLDFLFVFDKAGHCTAYLFYVLFWAIALSTTRLKNKGLMIALITSIILGVSMEILQKLIFVGRAADYLDLIANITGSFLGTFLFIKLIKT